MKTRAHRQPQQEVTRQSVLLPAAQPATQPTRAITWSLTDLRRWWMSPARLRWRRTVVALQGIGLTNFGDVL